MKYIFIVLAMIVFSALFHFLFGVEDWLKRGLFIGLVFAGGYLFGGAK